MWMVNFVLMMLLVLQCPIGPSWQIRLTIMIIDASVWPSRALAESGTAQRTTYLLAATCFA